MECKTKRLIYLWEGMSKDYFGGNWNRSVFIGIFKETYSLFKEFSDIQKVDKRLLPLLRKVVEYTACLVPERLEEVVALAFTEALIGLLTGETTYFEEDGEEYLLARTSMNGIEYSFDIIPGQEEEIFTFFCSTLLDNAPYGGYTENTR